MPSSRSFDTSDVGSTIASRAPLKLGTAGRGKSVGSSRDGSGDASRLCQYSSGSASEPPSTCSRCQMEKSAYCTGSGDDAGSSPREYASYPSLSSRNITPFDQPSDAM